jgi:hypothetical protein
MSVTFITNEILRKKEYDMDGLERLLYTPQDKVYTFDDNVCERREKLKFQCLICDGNVLKTSRNRKDYCETCVPLKCVQCKITLKNETISLKMNNDDYVYASCVKCNFVYPVREDIKDPGYD